MTKSTIDKSTREKLYSQRGKVFWMTGLSASGKSTIVDITNVLSESQINQYNAYIVKLDAITK